MGVLLQVFAENLQRSSPGLAPGILLGVARSTPLEKLPENSFAKFRQEFLREIPPEVTPRNSSKSEVSPDDLPGTLPRVSLEIPFG